MKLYILLSRIKMVPFSLFIFSHKRKFYLQTYSITFPPFPYLLTHIFHTQLLRAFRPADWLKIHLNLVFRLCILFMHFVHTRVCIKHNARFHSSDFSLVLLSRKFTAVHNVVLQQISSAVIRFANFLLNIINKLDNYHQLLSKLPADLKKFLHVVKRIRTCQLLAIMNSTSLTKLFAIGLFSEEDSLNKI